MKFFPQIELKINEYVKYEKMVKISLTINLKPKYSSSSGSQSGCQAFMDIKCPSSGKYTTAHSSRKSGKSLASNRAAAVTSFVMSCCRSFSVRWKPLKIVLYRRTKWFCKTSNWFWSGYFLKICSTFGGSTKIVPKTAHNEKNIKF